MRAPIVDAHKYVADQVGQVICTQLNRTDLSPDILVHDGSKTQAMWQVLDETSEKLRSGNV